MSASWSSGENRVNADLTTCHAVAEMMQLDIEVLGSGPDLREASNLERSAVVFKNLAMDLGTNVGDLEAILFKLIDETHHHRNGR
jgi:hypothetical protein